MDKTEVKDELSTLKKKRKRAKNMKDIPDGEEEEKTEKENIKNYLEFTPEEKYIQLQAEIIIIIYAKILIQIQIYL